MAIDLSEEGILRYIENDHPRRLDAVKGAISGFAGTGIGYGAYLLGAGTLFGIGIGIGLFIYLFTFSQE